MPPSPQQPQNPQTPQGPNPQTPQGSYGTPPPGPYGQQPPSPAPGPYDHQPPAPSTPPAQPNPYGQQPPTPPGPQNNPYATPYPQAPYPPQPHNWGAPTMSPPPKKRRVGLIVGITGGVVGVLVIVGIVLALIGTAAGGGFPEAKFRLTLPKTLVDGSFQLEQDLSDTKGQEIEEEANGAWDAKDTKAVVGQYSQGGDRTRGALVLSGFYGRFKNTDKARRNMLEGAAEADGVTLEAGPKDFPRSGEPTISCEVLTQEELGTTLTYPTCSWADGNTGAIIVVMDSDTLGQDASEIDLEHYAEVTRQVRSETVKPIG
ncbi:MULTISPECIES: hypothetical protein [Streptomyces]|nr:hypothetical protein [Streptomyces thermoviolaceus]MCM3263087.1 hypothetical protein [Streptomyces thermoviolaceus]WTD50862.1 hypothetical protein OG899_07920 [Streptomyces thermoviolaceus]GGV75778.1 hypothetical protein GCM10010499_32660 [Streptomyces thermoviolaceus subsp. apingens]GHB02668.1 hypothetical protein GCM10010512_37710 [Streptomyces thermoviolaceus subsp. thermoviolaceus]